MATVLYTLPLACSCYIHDYIKYFFLAGVVIVRKEGYPYPQDLPEGRWAVYEVTLPSKPTSAVSITFHSLSMRMQLEPTSMVFEPTFWNVPQDLVIYAIEDNLDLMSPYSASFNMSLSSEDFNYNEQYVPDFSLTVEDNDEGIIMCMFHLCICTYTLLYIYKRTYIHKYICIYIVHTYVCTYIRTYICLYIYTYVRTHICTYTVHPSTYIHTWCIHPHTYIVYMHTHTHIYKNTCKMQLHVCI